MQSNNGQDDNGSGKDNGHDNVIAMPTQKEHAKQRAKSGRVRMKVTLGQPGGTYKGATGKAKEPLLNMPPFTKILVLLILGIHTASVLLLNPEQKYWLMEHFGFVPAYYSGAMPFEWTALMAPLTFALLHGGWAHVLMNAVMLLAFGAGLERWIGWKRMAIFMLGCSLASIAVQFAVNINSDNPVIGASGAISGMFGAVVIMIQQQRDSPLQGRFGLMPFIAVWIIVAVIFGIMGGPGGEMIAWPAHIGGFLAGLALIKPVMRLKV